MSDIERYIGKKLVSVKNMGRQDDDPLVSVTTAFGYECWLTRVDSPWGMRGYVGTVVIPEGHPWYGRSVDELVEEGFAVQKAEEVEDASSGLTHWAVGFSTASEKIPDYMRTHEYAADKLRMLAQQAHDVGAGEWNPPVPPKKQPLTSALDKKLVEIRDGMPPKLPAEKYRPIVDREVDGFRLCLLSTVPFGTNAISYVVVLYAALDDVGMGVAINTHGMPAVYEFNTYLAAKLAFEALASLGKVGEVE